MVLIFFSKTIEFSKKFQHRSKEFELLELQVGRCNEKLQGYDREIELGKLAARQAFTSIGTLKYYYQLKNPFSKNPRLEPAQYFILFPWNIIIDLVLVQIICNAIFQPLVSFCDSLLYLGSASWFFAGYLYGFALGSISSDNTHDIELFTYNMKKADQDTLYNSVCKFNEFLALIVIQNVITITRTFCTVFALLYCFVRITASIFGVESSKNTENPGKKGVFLDPSIPSLKFFDAENANTGLTEDQLVAVNTQS